MIKEFEISDILDAINSISKKTSKKDESLQIKNKSEEKDDVLATNNQAKSNKSEILVLDQMIE